jgi:nitroreductase
MDIFEAIMTRRSAHRTGNGIPPRELIQKLLDAAVAAPNHHLTEPWRFVVLAGDALKDLGEAWAAAEERIGGSDPASARDLPLRAPVIIVVIESPKTHVSKILEIEEHHAVGAALQNILLTAHGAGLAAMIRTGPAAQMAEIREWLGMEPRELIAGFIYVGYPHETYVPGAPRKTAAAELTEWRGWDS